jgi:hypothetical protein
VNADDIIHVCECRCHCTLLKYHKSNSYKGMGMLLVPLISLEYSSDINIGMLHAAFLYLDRNCTYQAAAQNFYY